jgi:hypothetical protein
VTAFAAPDPAMANWIVGEFAEPTARYGTLTINLYGMSASMAKIVMDSLDLNCWPSLSRSPFW